MLEYTASQIELQLMHTPSIPFRNANKYSHFRTAYDIIKLYLPWANSGPWDISKIYNYIEINTVLKFKTYIYNIFITNSNYVIFGNN
jgi:hypothetical protein